MGFISGGAPWRRLCLRCGNKWRVIIKSYETIPAGRLGDTEALPASDSIYSGIVTTSEQIIAVPSGADFVLFSFTGPVYVNYDTTVAIPVGTVSQAGGELNPIKRYIGETTNIHLIASASIKVTMVFYSK